MPWKLCLLTAEHASLNIIDRFNSLIACKELCDQEIWETNWNVMILLNEQNMKMTELDTEMSNMGPSMFGRLCFDNWSQNCLQNPYRLTS